MTPVEKGISKLENWLSEGYVVIASLAPLYLAEFEENSGKVVSALVILGFHGVEETITVLPEIVKVRKKAEKYSRNPVIYNSCPVVWDLIMLYQPTLGG
jgi:hypothetical protein